MINDQPITRNQPRTRSRLARRYDSEAPAPERRRGLRRRPSATEQADFIPPTPEGTVTLVVEPPVAPEPPAPREEVLEPLTLGALTATTLALQVNTDRDATILGITTAGETVKLAAVEPAGDQS